MHKFVKCCRFCKIFDNIYTYNEIDKPFIQSDSFIAVASIGALVEGWSLIIPQKHVFSMKSFFSDPEFVSITKKVINRTKACYGNLIAFEHGSNYDGSITACGTNHAHLHIVPFDGELIISSIKDSEMEWTYCYASEIASKVKDKEYLFFCDIKKTDNWENKLGFLHILEKPTSQFFRRIIANKLDCSSQSNYRDYPFLENAQKTRQELALETV